jgi:hypothetical protein
MVLIIFSAVREVAETEGVSFREVQRRLRESKLKPRATGSVTEVSKLKSRGTGSVTEVEQYRNDIVGGVENMLSPSPCRMKKATEGGPLATDAHGAKCSLNNCLHQPHYTSPDSPPLVTSFTSAAITARPGASIPPQTCRHGGRSAKRQHQARALAAQTGGRGGGRLPQLVGRQVEKVRQCRTVLVSLPSAQPHPSLMR